MSDNTTTLAPVSDVSILSTAHNPFNLTVDMRWELSEIFCTAFHGYKREYLEYKQDLKDHLAKPDRNEEHDAVLISLCDFSERHMRNVAKTYQSLTGSDFWLDEFNKIVQENKTFTVNSLDTDKE